MSKLIDKDRGRDTTRRNSIPRSWCWTALVGLLVATVLPLVGSQRRTDAANRCALDRQSIDSTYQVRVISSDGQRHVFCCLRCAELWLSQTAVRPVRIVVVDESTQEPLDAETANYVRSSVFSNGPAGDRRHVFGSLQQAQAHAKTYRGRILTDEQRPFTDFENQDGSVGRNGRHRPSSQANSS